MDKLKRMLAVLALLLGLSTVSIVVSEGVASAAWSCTVTPKSGDASRTWASCYTDTPGTTRGWVRAVTGCADSTHQFEIVGSTAQAPYHNGWTGVSETAVGCNGSVIYRTYQSGYN